MIAPADRPAFSVAGPTFAVPCESPAALHVALGGSVSRPAAVAAVDCVVLAAGLRSNSAAAATKVPAAPSRATVVRTWGFIDPPRMPLERRTAAGDLTR